MRAKGDEKKERLLSLEYSVAQGWPVILHCVVSVSQCNLLLIDCFQTHNTTDERTLSLSQDCVALYHH